jgi:ribonuclease HII
MNGGEKMPSDEGTHYIAGIDEAGYSPLLGPLMITSVLFKTPQPEEPLWDSLRESVSRRACRSGRVQINDSKKVFTPAAGLGRLERGVLAALAASGIARPERFDELLKTICHHFGDPVAAQPWYENLSMPLPLVAEAEDISKAAADLAATMSKKGVALLDICSNPVHPPRLNRLIQQRGNKATVLFEETVVLIRRLLHLYGRKGIRIVADKQGMRQYYEPLLCQAFPMSRVDIVSESESLSEYRIDAGEGRMELCFAEKADVHHLPVALASMVSKYVREVFMSAFNGYWQERVPGLKPTSGYPKDARRFLAEVRAAWESAGINRGEVIRSR